MVELTKLTVEEIGDPDYETDLEALRAYLRLNDQGVMLGLHKVVFGRPWPEQNPSTVHKDWSIYFFEVPITTAMFNSFGELMGGRKAENVEDFTLTALRDVTGVEMIRGAIFISPEGLRRIREFTQN